MTFAQAFVSERHAGTAISPCRRPVEVAQTQISKITCLTRILAPPSATGTGGD